MGPLPKLDIKTHYPRPQQVGGYNFEDAILISDRLLQDISPNRSLPTELYTSRQAGLVCAPCLSEAEQRSKLPLSNGQP